MRTGKGGSVIENDAPLPAQMSPSLHTLIRMPFQSTLLGSFQMNEPNGPFISTESPTRSSRKPIVILPPFGYAELGRYILVCYFTVSRILTLQARRQLT